MSVALAKALFALLPAGLVFSVAARRFAAEKSSSTLMQWIGAGCFVIVVLCHICEAGNILPGMQWGREHSVGHYVDLAAAALGLLLFPAGYLLRALQRRE